MLPRRGLGNNNRPATGEVKVVDTEIRRAAELVVRDVVVHDNVAVRDRVVEDALRAGRVDVIVRSQDECSRWGINVISKAVPGFVNVGPGDVLAAPYEDLILLAGSRTLGGLIHGVSRQS